MTELAYLHALAVEKFEQARLWALWKLLPAGTTSVQLYRAGPALMTGDDLRLSTAPTTLYRPGHLA